LGMIFYDYCSEVKDVDLETALKGLLTMVQEIIDLGEREITINTEVVKKQLDNWMMTLPNYIKGLLGFSLCES
ncbi:IS4 family transposase, partial [Turicibacter sp. ISU324]|nr:IS4 family transposase [Turicibacter bilis]